MTVISGNSSRLLKNTHPLRYMLILRHCSVLIYMWLKGEGLFSHNKIIRSL